jgi:hypothetical protein
MAKASLQKTTQDSRINAIIESKDLKTKEKIIHIGELILSQKIPMNAIILAAGLQNENHKATLLAALEYASKTNPGIVNDEIFLFSIRSLVDEAPRVKWEAAKVIANTAHLFPKQLKKAVVPLLTNSEHAGTVVRWSAATALAKIIQANKSFNKELIPAIESILKWEKDKAIQKIYQQTLKKSAP